MPQDLELMRSIGRLSTDNLERPPLSSISMYREGYYLVTSMSKSSIEISLYSIVDPNTGLEIEQNV